MLGIVSTLAVGLSVTSVPARAQDEVFAKVDASMTLPQPGPHWVFTNGLVLRHSLLFDADSGEVMGIVDSGQGLAVQTPLWSRTRGEIITLDTAYSRYNRGERVDYLTIHDDSTLAFKSEIVLPIHIATSGPGPTHGSLLDGGRFVAVFSTLPRSEIAIVDLARGRVTDIVTVTGCAGIFAVGPARLASLCGDGSMLMIQLDAEGRKQAFVRSPKFFDPIEDPVSMYGVRDGTRWVFSSFAGKIHAVDFAGATPEPAPAWSLFSEHELAQGWRPGGAQWLALHRSTRRLYALAHQGEAGSHKDPGPEIRVHHLDDHSALQTIAAPNLAADFLGDLMKLPSDGVAAWLLERLVPNPGAANIAVSQDDAPLLYVGNDEVPLAAVLDATSGEHLRNLSEVGVTGPTFGVPPMTDDSNSERPAEGDSAESASP
jgi:methylamine dehydrogenase heavy chain